MCFFICVYFPLLGLFMYLFFAPYFSLFALNLALCMRLSSRGQKRPRGSRKKISRGSKKDPGLATRCFGAEEKIAQNNAQRLKKDRALLLGLIAGLKKSWP